MLERQKRLNEVYQYLHSHKSVHTKGEFADNIKYARPYISSALNGNEKYLTDNLFENICKAYPNVFELDYLLGGDGELLTIAEQARNQELEDMFPVAPAKKEPDTLEIFARMIRMMDDVRVELKKELAEVQSLKTELQQARDDFREATYHLTQAMRYLDHPQQVPMAADSSFEEVH